MPIYILFINNVTILCWDDFKNFWGKSDYVLFYQTHCEPNEPFWSPMSQKKHCGVHFCYEKSSSPKEPQNVYETHFGYENSLSHSELR